MASLVLNRQRHGEHSTLGSLHLARGLWLSWILERGPGPNRPNIDRIPAGEYPLIVRDWGDWYERLGRRPLVEIAEVPGRSAILCHPANHWKQLRGCPAPGLRHSKEDGEYSVWDSRDAFEKVNPYLLHVAREGGTLLVTDEVS